MRDKFERAARVVGALIVVVFGGVTVADVIGAVSDPQYLYGLVLAFGAGLVDLVVSAVASRFGVLGSASLDPRNVGATVSPGAHRQ